MRADRATDYSLLHECVLAVLLTALMICAAVVEPRFVRISTQLGLSVQIWEAALVALPMTLIILTGGIDLSVGSTMALSAVALGLSFAAGWSIWIGVLLALVTSMICGLINGLFIATLRVHPLIVTLATFSAYRGLAEGISRGVPVSGFPESYGALGQGTIAGIPGPAFAVAILAAILSLLLWRAVAGRWIYAIGLNETASRFSGIPVARMKILLYTFSGLMAGVAAVLLVARRNTAKADTGDGMELAVITAVVLGGTSIFGGRGRIIGTLLGLALLHEANQFVSWHWQREEFNLITTGGLLIASVLLNSLLTGRYKGSR